MSDYFPEEVVMMILVRSPTKSLLKCTSVSKSWHSLITSPSFITTHLNAQQTNPTQHLICRQTSKTNDWCESETASPESYWLVVDNNTTFGPTYIGAIGSRHLYPLEVSGSSLHTKLEFPFRAFNSFFRILDSCNGVLCLADDLFRYTDTTILWNPMIRKSVSLPEPSSTFLTHGSHQLVLGFGFDPTTNDYKVVRMLYPERPDSFLYMAPPVVELYSLNTGSWKIISPPGCQHIPERNWSQAFVNGAVHWLANDRTEDRFLSQILSFNMSDELFGEILLPTSLSNSIVVANMSVAVIGGFLSLLPYARYRHIGCHRTIWVMKEYGVVESWTKLFSINDDLLVGPFGRVLSIRNTCHRVLLVTADQVLVLYDYKTRQAIQLGVVEVLGSLYLKSYTQSLVLLDKGKSDKAGEPNLVPVSRTGSIISVTF